MARLNNPIILEITREDGRRMAIDVIPAYAEESHGFVATEDLRLYEGYPPDEWNSPADEAQRERYLDHLDQMGATNPCYLGLLRYLGGRNGKWVYAGGNLQPAELQQITAVIEGYITDIELTESAIKEILEETDADESSHTFAYNNGFRTDVIRLDTGGDGYLVLINEELTAEIELRDAHWAIVAGHIEDPDLLLEIINYIKQTKLR